MRSSIGLTIGLVVAFVAVCTILFLGLAMFSTIPEPEVGSEEATQLEELQEVVNISYAGFWGILLIFIVVIMLAFVLLLKRF